MIKTFYTLILATLISSGFAATSSFTAPSPLELKSNGAMIGPDKTGSPLGANSIDISATRGGPEEAASGLQSIVIGNQNTASAQQAIALGFQTYSLGYQSLALGVGTTSSGNNSVGIGYALAEGDKSVAIGLAEAGGLNSLAIGSTAQASADEVVSIGVGTRSTVANTVEFGRWSVAGITRASTIRLHPDGQAALTLANTATAPTDGGASAGAEANGTLPRGMVATRRDGTQIFQDLNISGTVYQDIKPRMVRITINGAAIGSAVMFTPAVGENYTLLRAYEVCSAMTGSQSGTPNMFLRAGATNISNNQNSTTVALETRDFVLPNNRVHISNANPLTIAVTAAGTGSGGYTKTITVYAEIIKIY